MKSAALLPAILLAASATAQQSTPAQYTPPNQSVNQSFGVAGMEQLGPDDKPTAKKFVVDLGLVKNCPIAMSARQGGGLRVERAQDGKTPSQPFTVPSLTLHNPQGKRIVSAAITANGYGINNHATPLQTGNQTAPRSQPAARPRLTRTLTVKFQPDENNTVIGDFRLTGFVVLESITLDAVTFADGSTQSFASGSGCSVQPSPLMLVGNGLK